MTSVPMKRGSGSMKARISWLVLGGPPAYTTMRWPRPRRRAPPGTGLMKLLARTGRPEHGKVAVQRKSRNMAAHRHGREGWEGDSEEAGIWGRVPARPLISAPQHTPLHPPLSIEGWRRLSKRRAGGRVSVDKVMGTLVFFHFILNIVIF